MGRLRWGILGTGRIARQFAAALPRSQRGALAVVASRSPDPPAAPEFAGARAHHGYGALLADPAVEAVYVATPHPAHAEWAARAAEAGRHVLCEKPLAMNAAEAEAVISAARRAGVFLMEGLAYRVHPQTRRLVGLVRSGAVGEIRLAQASFGIAVPRDPADRFFAKALGGGGILDLGCYCASMARLVAGAAAGEPFLDPVRVQGAGVLGAGGVDELAVATLEFPGGLVAQLSVAVALAQDNAVRLHGTRGRIEVASPWACSGKRGGRGVIAVRDAATGRAEEVAVETAEWLLGLEADAVAEHVAAGRAECPEITWADSLGNMRTLDAWRAAVGLEYDADRVGAAGAAPAAAARHGSPTAQRRVAGIATVGGAAGDGRGVDIA
jgi:predicted dehydrogenase